MSKVIDVYNGVYVKMLLVGDFNAEEGEIKNLIKQKTCFKNPENTSYIDSFTVKITSWVIRTSSTDMGQIIISRISQRCRLILFENTIHVACIQILTAPNVRIAEM